MPFLISSQTLSQAWEDAQNIARQMKNSAQAQKAAAQAGGVQSSRILNFERELRSYRDRLDVIAGMTGIAAYVTAQADTPGGYVATTEFAAMKTQLVATIQWIRDNFPLSVTPSAGYLLERTWGADGPAERTFSAAQLATYITQLDALLTSIG